MSSSDLVVNALGFNGENAPPPELGDDRLMILGRLFSEHLTEGSKAFAACEELIARRAALNKACDKFVQGQVDPIRERIVEQHEAAKAACREQQRKISELRAKITEADGELFTKRDAVARRLAALHTAEARRKDLSRFSARAQFLAADVAIEEAQEKLDRANTEERECWQYANALKLEEMKPLADEMNRLAGEEQRLRCLISGQSYTNELGLVVPAGRPL